MLQIPIPNRIKNLSPSSQNYQNPSRELKNNVQIKSQKTNFLYDVIMPNTLDSKNILILKKHAQANSPQNINKKIVQMKKSKIQKKIQAIITKSTQNSQKPINDASKVTKFIKQTLNKESKFATNDKYKKFIFDQQIPVERMVLTSQRYRTGRNKQNNFLTATKMSQKNNWIDNSYEEQKISPFVIETDEKLVEKQKLSEEAFQPFKQKIKKVIDKTITTGQNGKVNTLMEKVNFYLTSISQSPKKERYKKIKVNVHQKDQKIKSYCEQIQKGLFLKNYGKKNKKRSEENTPQMRQYRSVSNLTKNRPVTAGSPSQSVYQSRKRVLSSSSYHNSNSKLNRYTISSAEFNVKSKLSRIETQKNQMNNLLGQIESTCWQSQFGKQIITRKMNKMAKQWGIDEKGYRVYDNKKMEMTEETLEMIKKIRMRAAEIEQVQNQLIDQEK